MEILLCKEFDDAIVAYIVKKWNKVSQIPLGRTIIQKVCYFIKSKGVPLDYDFDMYHYGPYSQDLYFRMEDLAFENIVDDINTVSHVGSKASKSEYKLGESADELLKMYKKDIKPYIPTIDGVIELFSEFNPTALELLSTIHYYQTTLTNYYKKPATKDEVMGNVKKAKGDKFEDSLISKAYDALEQAGVFNWNTKN